MENKSESTSRVSGFPLSYPTAKKISRLGIIWKTCSVREDKLEELGKAKQSNRLGCIQPGHFL